MKTIKLVAAVFLLATFISCDDDDNNNLINVTSETVVNLHAPQSGGVDQMGNFTPISGDFTKFNFATGLTTTSATDWDIAFRATTIVVNGGVSYGATDEPARNGSGAVYIASGTTMASVTEVNTSLLTQDDTSGYAIATGSGNGWYTHQPNPINLISPTAGKILVIKTHDGKYAKVEILSYYKDSPVSPDSLTDESRYYTFNYVYQPNDGVITF